MKRRMVVALAATLIMTGCVTRQEVTRLEDDKIRTVCIVEHPAVMTSALDTIKEGISRRGLTLRVIKGTYELKHSAWAPRFQKADSVGCDALLFYVANWSWDLAYYMRFANIWMTDPSGSRRLAQATYDASRNVGLGKFIVARDKLLELVDQMFAGVTPRTAAPAMENAVPAPQAPLGSNPNPDAKSRLTQLEELRKQGVISEQEYTTKRKAILDSL